MYFVLLFLNFLPVIFLDPLKISFSIVKISCRRGEIYENRIRSNLHPSEICSVTL